ncbi:MAG: DUF3179 domain-containing protein [Pseudomonadota bacterium]
MARSPFIRIPRTLAAFLLVGGALTIGQVSQLAEMTPTAMAQGQSNSDFWKQQGWKTNFDLISVDEQEILSGGPPKDGIPSIDDPLFIPIESARTYDDLEPVIGLTINGDARAYPLSVLTWHEIVNDVVGGVPVAVTYCPLCNAAIVFERTLDGEPVEFGTTGKLRRSDLIMYDRKTESWWQQFSGEAIIGDLLGQKLKVVPSRLESWGKFKERLPEGKVLVPNNPEFRAYGNNPYIAYDRSQTPFLFRGELPKDIPAMARVVIVRNGADKDPFIVSMQHVRLEGPVVDGDVTVTWEKGQSSALDRQRIADGRDVGNIVVQTTANGTPEDLPYDVTFAFVANSFHPDVKIVQQ